MTPLSLWDKPLCNDVELDVMTCREDDFCPATPDANETPRHKYAWGGSQASRDAASSVDVNARRARTQISQRHVRREPRRTLILHAETASDGPTTREDSRMTTPRCGGG